MFSKLFNKNSKFTLELTNHILSFDLPQGWILDTEMQEPISFYKETDGTGALQVSVVTFQGDKKPNKKTVLDKHSPQELKEYKIREWTVYEFDEPTVEMFNKSFYFVKENMMIFITYYGSFESKESKELKDAIKIAQSVTVKEKNSILLVYKLKIKSSYKKNIEEPADASFDTLQWWMGNSTIWRFKTFAIDHDIHINKISNKDNRPITDDIVKMTMENTTKHFGDVISEYKIIEFEQPVVTDQAKKVLKSVGLNPNLESNEEFAFWNPDNQKYRTQSQPKVEN